MAFNSTPEYLKFVDELFGKCNLTEDLKFSLLGKVRSMYRFEVEQIQSNIEKRYSDPMLWIGLYIALASLCCILAMGADLLHGLRSRKLWFPCKYFSINAFSLSVIAVAMKLPMDLTAPMPGMVDQLAKLGSMAFICTMMANLLPCLATMDNNQLLTNVTALVVLVITLVINVCIQLQTGVVGPTSTQRAPIDRIRYMIPDGNLRIVSEVRTFTLAAVYVTFLLLLLIIHVCSSLAILKSKQIIDSKYQQGHEKASKEVQQSTEKFLTFEKLQQHVSNYLIMAESGSPQFIIASSATTTASGVICTLTTILHTLTVFMYIYTPTLLEKGYYGYGSDYKWSTLLILIVQLVGIVLGTIAPLSRCFATLSFKVSRKIILNHMKVFKIESYWTQKLYDWKHGSIRIPFRIHKLMVIVKNLESSILSFCIKLQEGVVVVCKMTALIPFFFMICLLYCFRCLKWLSQAFFNSLKKRNGRMEQSPYVLQLDDEREFAKRTLKSLSKSVNRLLQNGEKKQPTYLKKLIVEKSTKSFQGVKMFGSNNNHIQCSPSKVVEYRDSWSLAVVSLTTVVVTLPNTAKVEVDNLLRSVREGLEYITLVEENLNATDDYVSIQKAAKTLWQEVDVSHKWLGIKLEDIASQVNATASLEDTILQIVQLFSKEAKNNISNEGVGSVNGGGQIGDSKFTSICALSMARVCETIIAHNEHHKNLFDKLSSWIADIMAACLTNIPRVIAMKCHTSAIEKREACVHAAAYLLGETKEIINTLQDWDVPSMSPNDLPFIAKWHAYLSDP